MSTIIDLGKMTKSKYPGVYDDLDDAVLGSKIKTKYPGSYDDFTDVKPVQAKSTLEKASGIVPNLALGIAKGIGSTIAGASELGYKTLLKPIEKLTTGTAGQTAVQKFGVQEKLQPTTTSQKIGFGAEQIAEFFAPGGVIGKAGKAVEGASKLQKVGALASKVGAEALGAGGITALQAGDMNKNVATNASIAGALPIVGKGISSLSVPVKKFLSENIAPRIVNSILKPISKEFEFGRNAGAGVVKEGIIGRTREDLLNKITSKKQEIGKSMDLILNKPENISKQINLAEALKPVDDAIEKAVKSGEQGLFDRLTAIKNGMTKEFGQVEGKLVPIAEKKLIVSPIEAKQLKTELGQATKWTGQAFDNDVNKVRVKIYQNIDKMIDNAVPGIDKLNSRYANILSAEKSLDRTIDIIQRQNLVGLKDLGVGAAYGTAQSLTQGYVSPADFLIGILGSKVAGATITKTTLAKALGSLKPEEKSIVSKAIPLLRSIIFGLENNGQAK